MKTKRIISALLSILLAVVTVIGIGVSPIGGVLANAAGGTYVSGSCMLSNASTVLYSANFTAAPSSDDGLVYLYQLKTYQYSIPSGAQPVASTASTANVAIAFPLGGTEASGRLYAKFVLAAKQGGALVMLGTPQYISNPELLATHTHRENRPAKCQVGDELTNLTINGSGNGNMPTAFTKHTIQVLCGANSTVTNPKAKAADSHPVTAQYYMLNAATDAGIEGLVRDMTNYASNGKGQDFIIGNEVNERMWNYMAWTGWDDYMREYVQAFRVCYTAIKSSNANARVYISLDQNWDRNRSAGHSEYYSYMDGADFINTFAVNILSGGNIDWDLAIHPYTVPLTYAKFWDMSGTSDGAYCAKQIQNNSMMSFQNMSVVSTFMAQPTLRNRSGNIRDIIINEFGVSTAQGEDVQAAALCAAYYSFSKNPCITQFMYLSNAGYGVDSTMYPKTLAVFNDLGTGNEASRMAWAKGVIGISDWSAVIK